MASELCESAMIIDKLNEEFDEVVKEKDELSKELRLLKENMFGRPLIHNVKMNSMKEYDEMMEKIEEMILELNRSFKRFINDDEALDINELFNEKEKYVDILESHLGLSREWCKYRIDITLERLKSLNDFNRFWWENMIRDGACELVIENVIDSIVEGGEYDIELHDIYTVEQEFIIQSKRKGGAGHEPAKTLVNT